MYHPLRPQTIQDRIDRDQTGSVEVTPADMAATLRTEIDKLTKGIAYRERMIDRAKARKEARMVTQWEREIKNYREMASRFSKRLADLTAEIAALEAAEA